MEFRNSVTMKFSNATTSTSATIQRQTTKATQRALSLTYSETWLDCPTKAPRLLSASMASSTFSKVIGAKSMR